MPIAARSRPVICAPSSVLQEVLSGISDRLRFEALRARLAGFQFLLAHEDDHILAAEIDNNCRRAGISATSFDCLIAALTLRGGGTLFTTDADFERIASVCGLPLYSRGHH